MTDLPAIDILPSAPEFAEGMERLFIDVFDPGTTAETCEQCMIAAHFRHHLTLFPEGQFVAFEQATRRVVGLAVALRTSYNAAEPYSKSWWQSCGEGWLTTHQPDGEWLLGVESVVDAAYRGHGIGGRLMEQRRALVRRLNLRGIVAGSMPRDYHLVEMPIEDYVQAVVSGRLFDTNLSKHLRMGFRAVQIIPQYVIDAESRQYGVLIIWDNPDYREKGV
ncbi:MAG: GNAT family N-acetyltransferase [Chloroflexota bacterium]|nr:GNAT family N-acetyltransferase [Chloroflexota bacterium]